MGVEIRVENLTKRFGRQTIWEDVSLTLPKGEISVLLGPSGTGKSVFLKTLIGLLKPENGSIIIDGTDITKVKERELYEVRKLFGVLFQDGALFGSQNLFDNVAFPLREHTKKSESEIKKIVLDKMEIVGLTGAEKKLPGEISGGMRKRAGLARALVLDPQILLFDEPDSGLDPVRTAYLNQLIVDLNAQIEATFLIVTHDINTARTVPDNIGLLYRRHLAMFGPREMLLSSNEPVVRQFLNAQREGPIGMAEEKDAGELESEKGIELGALPPIPAQLPTSSGELRSTERAPGSWLRENGVVPPPGSFPGLDLEFSGSAQGSRSGSSSRSTTAATSAPAGVRVVPSVSTEERVERARAAAARSTAPKATAAATTKASATKAAASKPAARATTAPKPVPRAAAKTSAPAASAAPTKPASTRATRKAEAKAAEPAAPKRRGTKG